MPERIDLKLVDYRAESGALHERAKALKTGQLVEIGVVNEQLSEKYGRDIIQTAWAEVKESRGGRYIVHLAQPPAFVRSRFQGVVELEIEPRHVRGFQFGT